MPVYSPLQKNVEVHVRKIMLIFMVMVATLLSCTQLYTSKAATIRIKGSDTMLPLVQSWAEFYMETNERMAIYVEGGGTATGAQALATGNADLAMASRPLQPDELQLLAQNFNKVGISILVAKDALSIFLHPQNPVQNLTLTQIEQIFRGEISNWQQVGGADARINVVSRTPNSGTFLYFQEHVLQGEPYREDRLTAPTLRTMIELIADDPFAIGYGGITLDKRIKYCAINGVESTVENIENDSYPIIRYLYLYAVDTPTGRLEKFTDWVLSREAQELAHLAGFYPIWR